MYRRPGHSDRPAPGPPPPTGYDPYWPGHPLPIRHTGRHEQPGYGYAPDGHDPGYGAHADPYASGGRAGHPDGTGHGHRADGYDDPYRPDVVGHRTGRPDPDGHHTGWSDGTGHHRPADHLDEPFRPATGYAAGGLDDLRPVSGDDGLGWHPDPAGPQAPADRSGFFDEPAEEQPDPERSRRLPRGAVWAGAAAAATLVLMLALAAVLLPGRSGGQSQTAATGGAVAPDVQPQAPVSLGPPVQVQPVGPTATGSAPAPATSAAAARPGSTAARPSPTPAKARPKPKPKLSAAPAPASPAALAAGPAAQVVQLVNQQRAAAGCAPMTVNAQLTTAAQLHSQDQAARTTMSHVGGDGSTFDQRILRTGYRADAMAENVAFGYPTAAAVMDGWMNSPGHRANILNCALKGIGVGVATGPDGLLYWTQDFGSVA
jgi:uncharacterized protein YkwD